MVVLREGQYACNSTIEVVYRKGREHVVPDALSKAVLIDAVANVEAEDNWYHSMCQKVEDCPEKVPLWQVKKGQLFKRVDIAYPELTEHVDGLVMVISKKKRKEIISNHHNSITSTHLGVFKIRTKIDRKYY